MTGLTPADGPQGAGSVAPGTAHLIVVAQVGVARRTLEVVVAVGGAVSVDAPLIASRKIYLKGDVKVDGVKALDDPTPVEASIHSTFVDAGDGLITWESEVGDVAEVTGKVSSAGTSANAIDFFSGMGTVNVAGGLESGAPPQPFPSIDIEARVDAASSNPSPATSLVGNVAIPNGQYYQSGDLVVNGDLLLEGGELFVEGSLTVNGAITGEGSVYVKGKSVFSGDASILATVGQNVALWSHGSVTLQGFSGSEYLDNLAQADPSGAGVWWPDARQTLADLQGLYNNGSPTSAYVGNGVHKETVDDMRRVLGGTQRGTGATYQDRAFNAIGLLRAAVDNQPQSAARDFVAKKLYDIELMHHSGGYDLDGNALPGGATGTIQAWLSGNPNGGGIVDAVVDRGYLALMPEIQAITNSIDYDKLGSSYFRGVVYTNGYLYATNDVTVLGSVLAKDDGSQTGETIDGKDLQPGDIYLANGVRLTYVESMFKDGNLGGGTGSLAVVSWMGR